MKSHSFAVSIILTSIVSAGATAGLLTLLDRNDNTQPVAQASDIRTTLTSLETRLSALENRSPSALTQSSTTPPAVIQQKEFKTGITNTAGENTFADPETQLSNEDLYAEIINQQQPAYRQQQLISAGFSADEASRIISLESEVELAQLYSQYQFRKTQLNRGNQSTRGRSARSNQVREQLGEELYERYLRANGQPTKIPVGVVIPGSPGADAGLQAGDQITTYGGKRVYNVFELNRLTVDGNEGESVLIEVQRNGQPVQLTIPRGPIGVRSN